MTPEGLPPRSEPQVADAYPSTSAMPVIAGYEVLCWLGSGGMGTVWKAKQLSTRREVALKLLRFGAIGSAKARQRFDREVELTSRLQHPNIAAVFDSGVHNGVYYYAMELISGEPLDEFVTREKLSTVRMLQLMHGVCHAVQHAHQRGVIHRDLKPSNILVDQDGQPHVLDFGLARALESAEVSALISIPTDLTGTPAYMSPEQAEGNSRVLDTRTDVYSLGVILYRLLTGRFPYNVDGSVLDVAQRIREGHILSPRRIALDVDGDLEALLLKALARDPEERYSSAAELALDLRRYLDGAPLAARRPTLMYVAQKWVQKHRRRITIAAALALIIAMLGVWAFKQIALAKSRADQANYDVLAERRLAQLADARNLIRRSDDEVAAQNWQEATSGYRRAGTILRNWNLLQLPVELALIDVLPNAPEPLITWRPDKAKVAGCDLLGNARHLHITLMDGTSRMLEIPTLRCTTIETAGSAGAIEAAVYRRQKLLKVARSGSSHTAVLIDLNKNQIIAKATIPGHISAGPVMSDDGQLVAAGATPVSKTYIVQWAPADSEIVHEILESEEVDIGALAVAGKRILCGGYNDLFVFDESGQSQAIARRFDYPAGLVRAVAISTDGKTALSGADDGRLLLWDVDHQTLIETLQPHGARITALAISPDGTLALAASDNHSVCLWSLAERRRLKSFSDDVASSNDLAFSDDQEFAITSNGDGLKLWSVNVPPAVPTIELDAAPTCMTVDAAGRLAAIGMGNGAAVVIDLRMGCELLRLVTTGDQSHSIQDIAFSADGCSVFTASVAALRKWDLASGRETTSTALRGSKVAFGSCGSLALELFPSEGLWSIKPDTGERQVQIDNRSQSTFGYSPDGSVVFATSESGATEFFDGHTGQLRSIIPAGDGPVTCVAISPSSQIALMGHASGMIRSTKIGDSGAADVTFIAHAGAVEQMQFASDGKTAISAGSDGTLKIWDLESKSELRRYTWPAGVAPRFCLSADNTKLLIASHGDRKLRIYDLSLPGRLLEMTNGLTTTPESAKSLSLWGQWYVALGKFDWASECLESARSAGADVDPATLFECYYATGKFGLAAGECERISRSSENAPLSLYASLWQKALSRKLATTQRVPE